MTILGQHTIDETRHIIRTAEFRMERAKPLVDGLPFSRENVALVQEWNAFTEVRWKKAHDAALALIFQAKFANPLLNESQIPAEKAYQLIIHATNAEGDGRIIRGDLSDLIGRLEKGSGKALDESGHPLPEGYDPDLAAYQNVDAKIKAGEKAAGDLKEGAKQAAFKVPWWVWGLGIGAVGSAAFVVYETQIKPFLPGTYAPRR